MKICVVIPAYNESKEIAPLVSGVRRHCPEVLVIDDGSKDNTAEIAEANGAIVFKNRKNQGKGTSLIAGFNYMLKHDFDAVITMDGDGQHLPEEIPNFIKTAVYSDNGIVIGNRMVQRMNMPGLRVLANKFMSWIISLMVGQDIADTQCGYRLIKRGVLEKLVLNTSNYDTESEILIKAARLGFKIESIQIKTVYQGEKSQINPFIDTLRFIRLICREMWSKKTK